MRHDLTPGESLSQTEGSGLPPSTLLGWYDSFLPCIWESEEEIPLESETNNIITHESLRAVRMRGVS